MRIFVLRPQLKLWFPTFLNIKEYFQIDRFMIHLCLKFFINFGDYKNKKKKVEKFSNSSRKFFMSSKLKKNFCTWISSESSMKALNIT